MEDVKLVIFDSDGTFYRQPNENFLETSFWTEVRNKSIDVIMEVLRMNRQEAETRFASLFKEYDGEVSRAFQDSFGMQVGEYFDRTWGMISPKKYVKEGRLEAETLDVIRRRGTYIAVLTNSPQVWTKRVLEELSVQEYFDGCAWTGEGDIRKPQEEAFLRVARHFEIEPERTVMVGNEENNDIITPNRIGMKTMRVNPYKNQTIAQHQIIDINQIRGYFA